MKESRLHILSDHPIHNTEDVLIILNEDNLSIQWGLYIGDVWIPYSKETINLDKNPELKALHHNGEWNDIEINCLMDCYSQVFEEIEG